MGRIGWFLATHRRLLWSLHGLTHRGRASDRACWVCRAVWLAIEDQPVFRAGMREASEGPWERWR